MKDVTFFQVNRIEDAQELLKERIPQRKEEVPLIEAYSRVLAEDIPSPAYIPPFHKALMDGAAVRSEDVQSASETSPVRLHCIEHIYTGAPPQKEITRGTCSMIATGAPLPQGACLSMSTGTSTRCFLVDRGVYSAPYFKGKIYLLVDRGVYSAAEAFSAFSKATGFAKLIRTTTGGDGVGYTPILFVLPNSRLVVAIPSCMGINPDGTANEETCTSPDIYIDWNQFETLEELLRYVRQEV